MDAEMETKETSNQNGNSCYDEYIKNLKLWKSNYDMHRWAEHFNQVVQYNDFLLKSHMYNTTGSANYAPTPAVSAQQQAQQTNNPALTNVYNLPSLTRRVAAELIDALILLSVKLFTVWMLTSSTDILAPDILFQLFLPEDLRDDSDLLDDEQLQLMLFSAFLYRFVSCAYEYYFIKTFGFTIGKKLLGLKVLQCRVIIDNQGGGGRNRVLLATSPDGRVSNHSAWVRSAFKNVSIAFLIPSSVTAIFNAHKRTSYDMVSNTIVVRLNARARHR